MMIILPIEILVVVEVGRLVDLEMEMNLEMEMEMGIVVAVDRRTDLRTVTGTNLVGVDRKARRVKLLRTTF